MKHRSTFLFLFLFLVVLTTLVSAQTFSRGPSGPAAQPTGRETIGEQAQDPLFILIIIGSIIVLIGVKDKKRKFQLLGLIFLIYLINIQQIEPTPTSPTITPDVDWQTELLNDINKSEMLIELTKETEIFDYSSPRIQEIKEDILLRSNSEREAIQNALDYVYINIPYDSGESDNICFSATGSSVLKSGTGQCDTQSFLLTSITRSLNIPTRIQVGCLYTEPFCDAKFAIMAVFGGPRRKPKFTELKDLEEFKVNGEYKFPRGTSGLHTWTEAWLDGEWVGLEATSGEFIDPNGCYKYDIEIEDVRIKRDMCVSVDFEYAKSCLLRG